MDNFYPLHQGFLIKSPPLNSSGYKRVSRWRKRWFVLRKDKTLSYYEKRNGAMLKSIDLTHCTNVEKDLEHKKFKHVFSIKIHGGKMDRIFYLVADTPFEMDSWVKEICKLLEFEKLGDPGTEKTAQITTPNVPSHTKKPSEEDERPDSGIHENNNCTDSLPDYDYIPPPRKMNAEDEKINYNLLVASAAKNPRQSSDLSSFQDYNVTANDPRSSYDIVPPPARISGTPVRQQHDNQPTYDVPPLHQPNCDIPPLHQPNYHISDQPDYDFPPLHQPNYDVPPVHQPNYDVLPVHQPNYDVPPAHQPDYDVPPVYQPDYDVPPVHQPDYDSPSSHTSPLSSSRPGEEIQPTYDVVPAQRHSSDQEVYDYVSQPSYNQSGAHYDQVPAPTDLLTGSDSKTYDYVPVHNQVPISEATRESVGERPNEYVNLTIPAKSANYDKPLPFIPTDKDNRDSGTGADIGGEEIYDVPPTKGLDERAPIIDRSSKPGASAPVVDRSSKPRESKPAQKEYINLGKSSTFRELREVPRRANLNRTGSLREDSEGEYLCMENPSRSSFTTSFSKKFPPAIPVNHSDSDEDGQHCYEYMKSPVQDASYENFQAQNTVKPAETLAARKLKGNYEDLQFSSPTKGTITKVPSPKNSRSNYTTIDLEKTKGFRKTQEDLNQGT